MRPSNDLFFFHTPQISLDYTVDIKWKNEHCETLLYEPSVITIEGKVSEATYPGPPNYESIENGDARETSLILALDKPVHVGKKW